MVKLTGQAGRRPRDLRREEAVLDAAEKDPVVQEPTPVGINGR